MDLHIGQIIQKEVERQGIPVEVFAKSINRERTTVYGIFARKYPDTALIELISKDPSTGKSHKFWRWGISRFSRSHSSLV